MNETIAQPKIDVKNLDFYYGNYHALKNINVSILDKHITAIIGPSGCGKSTLLRCFNKIYMLYSDQQAKGSIILNGNNILNPRQDLFQLRSKIGMVFQKPTPFHMSIFHNITFGVKLYEKLSKAALAERVEWALTQAALWNEVKDKLHQSGYNLSGGQQQRLCIARAIAVKPEVILFDEPTSTLDPISTTYIESLIKDLRRNYTIVIVTHNMQQAMRISDHTAYMYLGNLVEYGETSMIFHNAKEQATRDYIDGKF